MSSGAFYSAIYTCQPYHVMVKEKINILSYLILNRAEAVLMNVQFRWGFCALS
jgi:hypothetical protein